MRDWRAGERRLSDRLADMHEDATLPMARRMRLDDGVEPMRVLDLCRAAMDIDAQRSEA